MGQQGEELTYNEMRKQHVESLRIINKQHKEIEQLRVQLAGCAVAAAGGTDPKQSQVAEEGDYGWSPAYQEVLELRKKYDDLRWRMDQLEK